MTVRRTPLARLSLARPLWVVACCLAACCPSSGLLDGYALGASAQDIAAALPVSSVPALQPAVYGQTSPAQDVFDEANDTLTYQYGGLSTVSRTQLRATYQQRLNLLCSSRPLCPAPQAYPVLSAELTALNDPHSFIQDPDEFKDFVASATGGTRLQFGVRLAAFEGENRLVLEVMPRSASADAGLRRGDILETLDAQPFQYEALRAAREAGRSIRLGVRRGQQRFQVTLSPRESTTLDLPTLSWLSLPVAGQPAPVQPKAAQAAATQPAAPAPKVRQPARRVALIRIPTFLSAGEVGQAVHQQVRAAQAGHAAGIIVDLRGNPGGDLSECDTAVSAFVPSFSRVSQGPQNISRTAVSAGKRFEDGLLLSSIPQPALWQGPLAVLIDSASASCSEFFAYELQYARTKRALSAALVVVGETTAGVANTATRLFPLSGGGALQLTILHYVKPDNQPYPQRVTPDVTATTDPFLLSQGKDSMLETALKALQRALP